MKNYQNARLLHDFCPKNARVLQNNCPKNIFANFGGHVLSLPPVSYAHGSVYCKFTAEYVGEGILKIGQHTVHYEVTKLLGFFGPPCMRHLTMLRSLSVGSQLIGRLLHCLKYEGEWVGGRPAPVNQMHQPPTKRQCVGYTTLFRQTLFRQTLFRQSTVGTPDG